MFPTIHAMHSSRWSLLQSAPRFRDRNSKCRWFRWWYCLSSHSATVIFCPVSRLGLGNTHSRFPLPFSTGNCQPSRALPPTTCAKLQHSSRLFYIQREALSVYHNCGFPVRVCTLHSPVLHQLLRTVRRLW